MSILQASWADFGFRRLGSFPATDGTPSTQERVEGAVHQAGYEAQAGGWVRRPERRRGVGFPGCIEIVAELGRGSPLADADLSFVDAHAASRWTAFEAGTEQVRGDFHDLSSLAAEAGAEARWRAFYRLTQALFYVGPEQLRPMLRRHVAPAFFRLCPEGKIVVLRYGTEIDSASALQRILYAMTQAPAADLVAEGFHGVQTMIRWHMASLTKLVPALLDIFSHLFYPFVGGVCAGLPGLAILLLFDPPERHGLPPFPRNWLAYPGRHAGYAREAADVAALAQSPDGPAHDRAGHHRLCHEREFAAGERTGLLRWYIERVNRLLYELTDPANFTEGRLPGGAIDPVFGYEHLLTVDRLRAKTMAAMSLDDAPTANLVAFEIADLYDTLSERFGQGLGPTVLFKRLFHPVDGTAMLVPRFAGMPPPFDGYFADLARRVYAKIQETVLASVWRKGKVVPGGVLVRDKTLANESAMPVPQFVSEVMRAYRNAHHGYFSSDPSSQNRPSRYLHLVDGNLPVEMSALPVLWWLSYLADPGMVGWRHLEVGHYD